MTDKVTSRSQERRRAEQKLGGLAKTQGRHGSGLDQYAMAKEVVGVKFWHILKTGIKMIIF